MVESLDLCETFSQVAAKHTMYKIINVQWNNCSRDSHQTKENYSY